MFQLVQLVSSSERRRQVDEDAARGLFEALSEAVAGDVRFDRGHRAMYAVDASNYREVPLGVVLPKDETDVIRAVEICREHRAAIVGRGGGTGIAGNTANHAVVLDFSRYLNRVLEVDGARGTARVQAGAVLDDLRDAAEAHGLTFGPDPATHENCTLGGMIGNNACGIHAVQSEFYGPGSKTSDNVERLRVLTYDGEVLELGPASADEVERIIEGGGRRADIYRELKRLVDDNDAIIRERYPDIPRRVSGYNLPDLLPERGFDVAKALVGSEGTCALVLEATVRLIPHLPARAMLVLSYASIDRAGDHVPLLRELRPVGCEAFDWRLVEYMDRQKMYAHARANLPEGDAWMLLELGGETREEAVARARDAQEILSHSDVPCEIKLVENEHEQQHYWDLREAGLGATAFVPGLPSTWDGWEDAAVPPEHVGNYLRDLLQLNEELGYAGSLYGHLAQGCIHQRITFDFGSDEGIQRYAEYTERAALICLKYGGSLSGEHGDGRARGDLLPLMFGEDGVGLMREFKRIWDPLGRMNPGRVVDTPPRTADLRLAKYPRVEPETVFRYPDDDGRFSQAALRCVGVGKCRRNEGGTMCPSWMVTHEEKHTTRGRAHLLWEMLENDVISRGWKSEDVKESLDLCLSCKGCKGECPVNVDIATYKAEFMYHYYRGRLRPRSAYAFGYIHHWSRLGSLVPSLANFVSHAPGLSSLFKGLAGFVSERDIPRFAQRSFRSSHRAPTMRATRSRRVLLWVDTFNNHFNPEGLQALADVLGAVGCAVDLPRRGLCCGRPAYEYGQLAVAKRLLLEILDALEPDIMAGVPVIGLEPSCISVFRDELRSLFPDDERAARLSRQVFTLAEYLMKEHRDWQLPALSGRAVLHGHCHDKSILDFEQSPRLLRELGLDVEVPDTGCCGMAGGFGYEPDKYEVSRACGERVLLPNVRAAERDTIICTDGFSCRSQIRDLSEREPITVPEVIAAALRTSALTERR